MKIYKLLIHFANHVQICALATSWTHKQTLIKIVSYARVVLTGDLKVQFGVKGLRIV